MNNEIITTEPKPAPFRIMYADEILFELCDPAAKLPERADDGCSGYDLFSVERVEVPPGEVKIVSTGLKWEPPTNEIELQVRPRSGMAAKHGVTVLNAPGTVDASYRGLIKAILINHSKIPYQVNVGDRIAQAVFARVEKSYTLKITDKVGETKRGEGGMGSTGR